MSEDAAGAPAPSTSGADGPAKSKLASSLSNTAALMRHELAGLRIAFSHAGIKGGGGEAIVRNFLRTRLPISIGITSGQVIDSQSGISRELDVILYDALRTPMLFTSPQEGRHLVPVEAVIAVVEVKSQLTSGDLTDVVKNCRSVKSLQRVAFFPTAIQTVHQRYGREWTDLPIFYSVFAFESDNMYAGPLNELQEEDDPWGRVDTVCYLDRGVNLNAEVGESLEKPVTFGYVNSGGVGGLADVKSDRALLLWYIGLSTAVLQGETRPINLEEYVLKEELQVQGTIPTGAVTERMRVVLTQRLVADPYGLDVETPLKIQRGEPITLEEAVKIIRSGLILKIGEEASAEERAFLELAKKIAEARQEPGS